MKIINSVIMRHWKILAFALATISVATAIFVNSLRIEYLPHIYSIDKSIEEASSALTLIDQKLTRKANQRGMLQILEGEALLDTKEDTCHLGARDCSLILFFPVKRTTMDFPIKSVFPNARSKLDTIREYLVYLKSILSSASPEEVAGRTKDAKDRVYDLAKIFPKTASQQAIIENAKSIKEPAIELIGPFLDWYVNYEKKKALKAAMADGSILIERIVNDSRMDAEFYASLPSGSKNFINALEDFDLSIKLNKSDVQQIVYEAAVYDVLLNTKTTTDIIKEFQVAHEALRSALEKENQALWRLAIAKDRLSRMADDFRTKVEQTSIAEEHPFDTAQIAEDNCITKPSSGRAKGARR